MDPFRDSPRKSLNYNEEINAAASRQLTSNSPISKWQATHESWKVFDELRSRGCFCDIILKSSDGAAFPAHRLIICTCSEYFRSLFSGRWQNDSNKDIYLPEIRGDTLEKVITFAYSREVEITSDLQAKELLLAANHLFIEELSARCIEYLTAGMSITNCVTLWCFAKNYCCLKLKAAAERFLLTNFQQVALSWRSTEERHVTELSAEEVMELISSDGLCVENEGVLFFLIVLWYAENSGDEHVLVMLLHCVRWSTLPQAYIRNVVLTHPLVRSSQQASALIASIVSGGDEVSSTSASELEEEEGERKWPLTASKLRERFNRVRDSQQLILVVGGWCGKSPTNSVEVHDPKQRRWIHATPVLPELLERRRAYHAVAAVDGWLYVIGGFDGYTIFNSCDRYHLATGRWQSMCGMAKRRCYVAVTTGDVGAGAGIFAIGGSNEMPSDSRLRSVEHFSPDNNTWTSLPDMIEQRSDAGACFMKGQIYVAGGFTGKECVASVEYYNSKAGQWTNLVPMRVPRSGVSVVAYLGRLVVLGGFDGFSRLRTVEYFDFEEQDWHKMPRMITKRSNFSSCVVGRKLYVMGGFNDPSTCAQFESFTTLPTASHHRATGGSLCSTCYDPKSLPAEPKPQQQIASPGSGDGDFVHPAAVMHDEGEGWSDKGLPLCKCQLSVTCSSSSSSVEFSCETRSLEQGGKWERQPNMIVERSAHSCCVVPSISSIPFLRRLNLSSDSAR